MGKTEKRSTFILCMLLIVITLTALSACNDKDKRKYVDIIVKHPTTGEVIADKGWMELKYEEVLVMPDISLKVRGNNVFLTDNDFDNRSLTSHMKLYIRHDGTYMEQLSWSNDWPKEIGQYEIAIKFNEDGLTGSESIDDKNYYRATFAFTLNIIE